MSAITLEKVSEVKRIDFFRFQIDMLQMLLSPEWFHERTRNDHPAYRRWALCQEILNKQGGAIRWPEQKNQLLDIATMGLDTSILSIVSGGDLQSLSIGSVNFKDETVRKKIQSRLQDAEQFDDIMVELYIGAWHQLEKHNVEYREQSGFPDFNIGITGIGMPTLVECKRARVMTKKRMLKRIAKANDQITHEQLTIGSAYGVVILDVTANQIAEAPDDELPPKLDPIIGLVRSCLKGTKNRSVGLAVITWDEYKTAGTPPNQVWFGFRRRSVRVLHKNPLVPVPQNLPVFDAWKVEYKLNFTPRGQPSAEDEMKLITEFEKHSI
jgi:hypothetical protein